MSSRQEVVTSCLQAMLRPVARLCLHHGVKLNDIVEALKVALVSAAKSEIEHSRSKGSSSRVAVMTGVHRRDVNRIDKLGEIKPQGESIISKVLGQWQQHPKFKTKSNKPAILSVEGDKSEFAELVRSVSADLNPYTVLYELERIGYVRKTSGGLKLCATSHIVSKNVKEGLGFLAEDMDDLIAAVEENIFTSGPAKNLHLKTDYDCISENALPEIQKWFFEQGQSLHKKAREFISKYDGDSNPALKTDGRKVRVAIGTFSRIDLTRSK